MATRARRALQSLFDSSFARGAVALISGTVLTQAIAVLCAPLLSRIYGLEDFGQFANFNAWVAMLALLSCARYEHAIVVAPDGQATSRVLALTFALCGAASVLYGIASLGLGAVSGGYVEEIRTFLHLIPVGVLVICVSSPLTMLSVREGRFRHLAYVAVAQVSATMVLQLGLGIAGSDRGLIFGAIGGHLVAGAMLAVPVVRSGALRAVRQQLTFGVLLSTAREYSRFPRFTLGADAIGVLVQQFSPVLILVVFGPAFAGLYAFSIRIVRVPLLVVSAAVMNVLRREAAVRLAAGSDLRRPYSLIVRGLFAIGMLPFGITLLFGPQLFAFVFGSEWAEAGRAVQILSPGILLEFVALPMSAIFLVTGTQHLAFRLQLLGLILLAASIVGGDAMFGSFIAACYLISAAMVLTGVLTLAVAGVVSRRPGMSVPVGAGDGQLRVGEVGGAGAA